jgi:hypothetical protein
LRSASDECSSLFYKIVNNDKKIYGLTITKAPKRAIATIAKLTIEYCVFKGNGYNDAVNNTDVNHLIGVLGTATIDNCDFYNNENSALLAESLSPLYNEPTFSKLSIFFTKENIESWIIL